MTLGGYLGHDNATALQETIGRILLDHGVGCDAPQTIPKTRAPEISTNLAISAIDTRIQF